MNSLPKARRPRWRYLAVVVETEPTAAAHDRRALQTAVWDATVALFGDPGSAAVDPTVVEHERTGSVVRARRDEVERARAALACVTAVGGERVALRVVAVSGTVRGSLRHLPDVPADDHEKEGI